MKAFERILIYSVLMVLVFYVFLADSKVESQVAIQDLIVAKSIIIVDDEGKEVLRLCISEDSGAMFVSNKDGTCVVAIGVYEDDGRIRVSNRDGKVIGSLP